jgi:hypothetical protein
VEEKDMTIAFSEIQDNDGFIIRSGSGYFVRFVGSNPQMVSSSVLASVFNYYDAIGIMIRMEKLGYAAEMIKQAG